MASRLVLAAFVLPGDAIVVSGNATALSMAVAQRRARAGLDATNINPDAGTVATRPVKGGTMDARALRKPLK